MTDRKVSIIAVTNKGRLDVQEHLIEETAPGDYSASFIFPEPVFILDVGLFGDGVNWISSHAKLLTPLELYSLSNSNPIGLISMLETQHYRPQGFKFVFPYTVAY